MSTPKPKAKRRLIDELNSDQNNKKARPGNHVESSQEVTSNSTSQNGASNITGKQQKVVKIVKNTKGVKQTLPSNKTAKNSKNEENNVVACRPNFQSIIETRRMKAK